MLNLKTRKAKLAWLYVIVWSFVVAGLFASDAFSSRETGKILEAIIRFFAPDITLHKLFRLHILIRKTAHFVEYGILAILSVRALVLSMTMQGHRLRTAAFAFLYVLFVAIIDESRQALSTQRSGRALDAAIDLSGAAAALLAWWLFLVWHRSRTKKNNSNKLAVPSECINKEQC